MVTSKIGSATTTKATADATATADRDTLVRRYFYGPIGAVDFNGMTFTGQIRALEGAANQNLRVQAIVRIIKPDCSERAVVIGADTATLTGDPTSEFDAATLTNRTFPRGSPASCANVQSENGDWLEIEVGYRKHAAISTTGSLCFGDSAGTDLAADETTTADNDPWFEFSGAIPLATNVPVAATGTILVNETFTGSDGDELHAHDANWIDLENALSGAGQRDQLVISNANRMRSAFNGAIHSGGYYYNVSPGTNEYDVRGDLFVASNSGSVALQSHVDSSTGSSHRMNTGPSFWAFTFQTAGNYGASFAFSPTVGSTYALEMRVRSDYIGLFLNGVLFRLIPNTEPSASGFPGVGDVANSASNTTQHQLDNFVAQEVGKGSLPPLNRARRAPVRLRR